MTEPTTKHTLPPTTKVWRYMSFAKFVWMLHMKQLWLTNVRFFDDKWEMMIDTSQINWFINKLADKFGDEVTADGVLMRIDGLLEEYRNQTFVSSWNASEHESYALWRICCPTPEGVAIQTSLERLQKSVKPLPVLEVFYSPVIDDELYKLTRLVAQKRPMFAYEQEVRVVLEQDFYDPNTPNRTVIGTGLPWNPEEHIENVWLHPDARSWFAESVDEIVRLLAPKLSRRIRLSKMNETPPVQG